MKFKERMEKFLELQSKNMDFEHISKELGITPSTLRNFLNKRGYKWDNGKYIIKEKIQEVEKNITKGKVKQIAFGELDTKEEKIKKETKVKKEKKIKKESQKNNVDKTVNKKNTERKLDSKEKKLSGKIKPKKDRKINITQDDLDKLCEVYDWYLQVKDYKSMKLKKSSVNKKDINLKENLGELKSTSIKVDKKVWEDFERLCSNSQFSKQEILTQALKDFMREYKHLL